jgi:non-specific serine/threonine protein kinase
VTADAAESSDGLSAVARARVAAAFARGPEHGLLDLGATKVGTPLDPPLAFLGDLSRAFVTRLRAAPDVADARERVEVDCPADERARLAGAVPPMPGGEYVDADWIAARWTEMGRAFSEEIRGHRGAVAAWLHARHPSWHVVGKVCLHLAENRGDDEHPFALVFTIVLAGPAGPRRPPAAGPPEPHARRGRPASLKGPGGPSVNP